LVDILLRNGRLKIAESILGMVKNHDYKWFNMMYKTKDNIEAIKFLNEANLKCQWETEP
jgi:hypothetical protein